MIITDRKRKAYDRKRKASRKEKAMITERRIKSIRGKTKLGGVLRHRKWLTRVVVVAKAVDYVTVRQADGFERTIKWMSLTGYKREDR